MRYEDIIVQGKGSSYCPCTAKDPTQCDFLKEYAFNLDQLNFTQVMAKLQDVAARYQTWRGFQEEPIIVFIVYETPKNICSERQTLINYFLKNGVECKELTYPIADNVE